MDTGWSRRLDLLPGLSTVWLPPGSLLWLGERASVCVDCTCATAESPFPSVTHQYRRQRGTEQLHLGTRTGMSLTDGISLGSSAAQGNPQGLEFCVHPLSSLSPARVHFSWHRRVNRCEHVYGAWLATAGTARGLHSQEMAIATFCRLPIKTHCCLAPPQAPTNL